MLANQFYNSSIRSYINLMCDMFSRIRVYRQRDGKVHSNVVPLSYASKEHFIIKLNSLNSINKGDKVAKVETVLPRMNIHLVDIQYNSTFKTSQLAKSLVANTVSGPINQHNPVPIKMMFELGIYTRHQDDMFQIVEQILPYFQPNFVTRMTELYRNDIKFERDIHITIQSVSIDETIDGEGNSRRRIEWSIMFDVNGWIYPPVVESTGLIRTIYLDFHTNPTDISVEVDFDSYDVEVVPRDVTKEKWIADGKPIVESNTSRIPIPTAPIEPGVRK